mgnify:FL=1
MKPQTKKTLLGLSGLAIAASTVSWAASWLFRIFMSFPAGQSALKSLFGGITLNPTVHSMPFSIFSYHQYASQYPQQIKWAWMLSVFAHMLLAWAIYAAVKKTPSLYGDARFATPAEITKAGLFIKRPPAKLPADLHKDGLFAGKAIIVGRLNNRYIGLSDQQFVYLAAPTRSGKGVGVVIPVGLSYDHSMVVLDIKQELFDITAAFRAKCGQAVYLFNPFDPEGKTARWNPLSYVSRSDELRVDDINQIAICLIPDSGGDDSFFEESARKLFIGLALHCLDKEAYYRKSGLIYTPTIREILDLATNFEGEAITHFTSLMGDEFVSVLAKQTINSAVSAGDKTFASILATLTANLTPWLSEPVVNATSGDDFDLRDVRKKRMTIYIGIQPKDLAKAKKIINLFYSQLINENTAVLPQNDDSLKYQCLMLMDEGTSPGRIAVLEKAVSYMAGYNMRMLFIAQSPAQLQDKSVYGEHGARNILTNVALKVLYKPNDVADSEEYSKLLGKITVTEDTQKSRGGGNKGVSRTESVNQRDLMMPQELREMSKDKEIIMFEGISHPIMAEKNKYYDDPVFVSRYKPYQGKAKVLPLKDRLNAEEKDQQDRESVRKDIDGLSRQTQILEDTIKGTLYKHIEITVLGNFIGRSIENSVQESTAAATV